MIRSIVLALVAVVATGCAHKPLSGADLDRVMRPAFISRIEEGAGPKSEVFTEDSSYKQKLAKLEPKEADRRLSNKMGKGMSRFEVADKLRSTTLALLPREIPWTNTVDPVAVAKELQSFLVEEVPANAPDYDLLKAEGADAIVEFVIEKYGMRSENGRAGVFVEGYGRMFFLESKHEIWYRAFRVDQVDAGLPHVDPFKVGKSDGVLFRQQMNDVLDAIAAQFAKDLSPADRRGGPAVQAEDKGGPDDTNKTGKTEQEEKKEPPPSDDLPSPDDESKK
ncbi:MAG: hypothetical protein ACJ790_00615 [Myxococcaceae bacterium]